jgi:hypothetical protein
MSAGRDLNRRFVRQTALSMLALGQATVVILAVVLQILNISLVADGGGCGGEADPGLDLALSFVALELCALLMPGLALVAGLALTHRDTPISRWGGVFFSIAIVLAVRGFGTLMLAGWRMEDILPALGFSLIMTFGLPEIIAGGWAWVRWSTPLKI